MTDRLEALLTEKRVILCMGGGGVGKTTVSASLAVAGALLGRRTAVLTIDPARRLKDSLGIHDLGADPRPVDLSGLGAPPSASLAAMMLDAKRTFDQLITRFAPSLEAAERILKNRLYQYVSGRLAGSQEYMALEKLYEIVTGGDYDLIVIDTPPTHHALDFLDAPQRMIDLIGSRAISYLQRPSLAIFGFGSRLAQAGLEIVLRALERFTGLGLLAEVADFVGSFESMLDGFRSRADAVRRLLRDPTTATVLVTSAEPLTIGETVSFHRELRRAGMALGAVVVNRTVPEHLLGVPGSGGGLPEGLGPKLDVARRELERLAERDRRVFAQIRAAVGAHAVIATVPAYPRDVASLADLATIGERLVPRVAERREAVPSIQPALRA